MGRECGRFRLYETDATAAYHARRLVHDNTWASMATTSRAFDGVAYANIVSFSGGKLLLKRLEGGGVFLMEGGWDIPDSIGDSDAASTGELFFYLTPMDATGTFSTTLNNFLC